MEKWTKRFVTPLIHAGGKIPLFQKVTHDPADRTGRTYECHCTKHAIAPNKRKFSHIRPPQFSRRVGLVSM